MTRSRYATFTQIVWQFICVRLILDIHIIFSFNVFEHERFDMVVTGHMTMFILLSLAGSFFFASYFRMMGERKKMYTFAILYYHLRLYYLERKPANEIQWNSNANCRHKFFISAYKIWKIIAICQKFANKHS